MSQDPREHLILDALYTDVGLDGAERAEAELSEILAERDSYYDAIRDMLDFACGWCRPMTDQERLQVIEKIGTNALGTVA